MAIRTADIIFRTTTGVALLSGRMNNLFLNGLINGVTDYAWLVIHNAHASLTLTGAVVWLTADGRGATVALGYDSTSGVQAFGAGWPDVAPSTLSYSSPTTMATGVALASVGAGNAVRVGVRRVLTSATVAVPENNTVHVGGTSPL